MDLRRQSHPWSNTHCPLINHWRESQHRRLHDLVSLSDWMIHLCLTCSQAAQLPLKLPSTPCYEINSLASPQPSILFPRLSVCALVAWFSLFLMSLMSASFAYAPSHLPFQLITPRSLSFHSLEPDVSGLFALCCVILEGDGASPQPGFHAFPRTGNLPSYCKRQRQEWIFHEPDTVWKFVCNCQYLAIKWKPGSILGPLFYSEIL